MNIATVINAHGNTDVVLDTIDAIRTFVGDKILVVVDGAAWDGWGNVVKLPAHKIQGFYHNYPRAPYRNLTLGLQQAVELWNPEEIDWYCYAEYDVLFTNDEFKHDLAVAKDHNIWCLGNDLRISNMKFPYLERIIGSPLSSAYYLLGCCVFHNSKFMKVLRQENFFNRFLMATNEFVNGFFPGYEEQEGYDFGEHLYPTLANHFGGKVAQFAYWNQFLEQWGGGGFKKYPLRWKPDISWNDIFPELTSIIHPLKGDSDLRWFHAVKRNRMKKDV